jgi:hypothetical protein
MRCFGVWFLRQIFVSRDAVELPGMRLASREQLRIPPRLPTAADKLKPAWLLDI